MDQRTKELIAIGASAAVNCHPCMTYHLKECDRLEIDRESVAAAVAVGQMVNRGAAGKTRAFTADLLGTPSTEPRQATADAAGCAC